MSRHGNRERVVITKLHEIFIIIFDPRLAKDKLIRASVA